MKEKPFLLVYLQIAIYFITAFVIFYNWYFPLVDEFILLGVPNILSLIFSLMCILITGGILGGILFYIILFIVIIINTYILK